jgi:hypothetical protein
LDSQVISRIALSSDTCCAQSLPIPPLILSLRRRSFFFSLAVWCMGTCPSRASRQPRIVNTPEQSEAAKLRWRQACKRIIRLLHLRRIWAHLGNYLNQVKDLTAGLERKKGKLVRVAPADSLAARRTSSLCVNL